MLKCGARFPNEAANKEARGENWLEKDEGASCLPGKSETDEEKGKKGKGMKNTEPGSKATGVQIIGNQG